MLDLAYAEKDITPEKPVDLCGYTLRKGGSIGVHDPLKIRWLGLKDGKGRKVLLGSADLISFSQEGYRELSTEICADGAGGEIVDNCHVGLATTHTHSGPATVKLRHCGKMDQAYLAGMKNGLVMSGRDALTAKGDGVNVVWGTGSSDVAVNRRSGEGGPIDQEVIVVGFLDAQTGALRATVVNFACHPVVLGHESNSVSADYPGYLSKHMEAHTGAPCLFLNGACGDINPRNDKSVMPGEAVKTGEAIAGVALEALRSAAPVRSDMLGWHCCSVRVPVRVPNSAHDFEDRLDMLEATFGISRSLFADRVISDTKRLAEGEYPQFVTLELTLLTIGEDLGILFVPGELFSSIGQRIKAVALPRKLLISGFSNGSVGYLPDRQAYQDGGYEPYFANFFYDFPEFDPAVEDVILDGAMRLLKSANEG